MVLVGHWGSHKGWFPFCLDKRYPTEWSGEFDLSYHFGERASRKLGSQLQTLVPLVCGQLDADHVALVDFIERPV